MQIRAEHRDHLGLFRKAGVGLPLNLLDLRGRFLYNARVAVNLICSTQKCTISAPPKLRCQDQQEREHRESEHPSQFACLNVVRNLPKVRGKQRGEENNQDHREQEWDAADKSSDPPCHDDGHHDQGGVKMGRS